MTLQLLPNLNVITFPPSRVTKRRRRKITACQVTPFPLARRKQIVHRIANGLESREGQFRDAFWFDAIAALREQLSAAGISEAAILREIRSFRSAVQFAIDFQRFGDAPNGKDGAA